MINYVYIFLDYFFLIFHTIFTLFNIFGWITIKTRKIHLITMLVTLFSWFVLGLKYGWGYCFCTDWHWQIRYKMGYRDMSYSYIHFLLLKITGIDFNENLIIQLTFIIFFICLAISIIMNLYDFNKNKL